MPKNIFSYSAENTVFRDERFLYPEFIPEKLPFREPQIEEIAACLKPVLRNGKPQNMFVFGSSGTGKTVTAKYVLRELEEFSSKAKGVYVNCFEFNTRNAVLNKICLALGRAVPRRGIAADEVFSELLNALKQSSLTPVVVLDEADRIVFDKNASALLYDLLRITEFQNAYIGIVMISNRNDLLSVLDSRVKSSIASRVIEFKPYTPQQLKKIISERAKHAFASEAVESETINLAAAFAAKNNGDARLAIEPLLIAGRIAEQENAKKLRVTHLRQAFEKLKPRQIQKTAPYIDSHEKKLLSILCTEKQMVSGKLFNEYSAQSAEPLTERSYRKKLNRLKELNLIKIKEIDKGIRGRTRNISLAQPTESIKQLCEADSLSK